MPLRKTCDYKYKVIKRNVYSKWHSCGIHTVCVLSVCVQAGLSLAFLGCGVLSGGNVGGQRGCREKRKEGGRAQYGAGIFWKEFFHPRVTYSTDWLKEGPCECVRMTTWVVRLLLTSICLHLLLWRQEPQITGMGPTRLSEVRLTVILRFMTPGGASHLDWQSLVSCWNPFLQVDSLLIPQIDNNKAVRFKEWIL